MGFARTQYRLSDSTGLGLPHNLKRIQSEIDVVVGVLENLCQESPCIISNFLGTSKVRTASAASILLLIGIVWSRKIFEEGED
jgi:hypothetical protein